MNETSPIKERLTKIRELEDSFGEQLKKSGWTVYKYDSEKYLEYLLALIEKVGSIDRFRPDFILCIGDEFYGIADLRLSNTSNPGTKKRADMYKLHMAGVLIRLRQYVKLLILSDNAKYDHFISGNYYGAMEHILTPEETNAIYLRNITDEEWRGLNKPVTGAEDKPRTVTFTSVRTETYKCEYKIEIPEDIKTDQISKYIEENKRKWQKSSEKLDRVQESKPEDLFVVEKG